jgi:phospholipase C
VDRREFLKRSLQVAGAATVSSAIGVEAMQAAAALDHTRRTKWQSVLDRPARESGIDTVVIVMMENRSFDAFLGWLDHEHRYRELGMRRYGADFRIFGDQTVSYPAPDGTMVETAHFPIHSAGPDIHRACGHNDPGHGWDAGRAERDFGFLSTGSGNDEFALSTWRGDDLPVYRNLAQRFVVCDRWHAALLGPTFPNREYLLSAQSGGHKDNYLPIAEGGFQWEALFDRLLANRVSVRNYASDLPVSLLFGERASPMVRTIDDYFTDCAAGALPHVSYVDPKFAEPGENDDHPLADFRAGQAFIRDVFAAFVRSPQWKRGLFIVTYDEWGGFYDHIRPPVVPDVRASADDEENFGQVGFRVPTMLASPRALPGFVDHTRYDHTSVIRFLEWRFLGAPAFGDHGNDWWLTTRDRYANNCGRALVSDFYDPQCHFDLDPVIAPPGPPCSGGAGGLGAPVRATHPLVDALHRGYFHEVAPKVMRRLRL